MLAIEVTFLLGRYTATDHRDRGRAEWPPHPSRLFSALVAAAAGRPEPGGRAALKWLEGLPPPHLHADPTPGVQAVETVFVPVNDPTADPLPGRAERQPRAFPSVVPDPPTVHFVWPDADPPDEVVRHLASACERVTYLGSSRSPALVRLDPAPPTANWVPDAGGDTILRVPGPGRLDDLEWHFQQDLRPPPGGTCAYRVVDRANGPSPAPARGAFGELFPYRLVGPTGMELETTLKVAECLRAATMARARDVLGHVPEVLSGHTPDGSPLDRTHAAYIPLPFVSPTQVHADGHLVGVGVVLPSGLPTPDRRGLGRVLAAVDHLTVGGVGRFALDRIAPGDRAPQTLRPDEWTRPARAWTSVTPVVLDRFPRRDGRDVGAVVAVACRRAGLPAPAEVAVSPVSPLYGVPPSASFPTHRPRPGRPRRLFTHLTVRFPDPVAGPVLLGSGRNFGLGLLRPLTDARP